MEALPFIRFDDPEDGFGLQQAVLEEVGRGERGPTMLVWSSSPYVAATRLETRLPGFGAGVGEAERLGFPVMVRNSGGGAVAANEGSLSFSLTFPVGEMREDLRERYDEGVGIVASALNKLGIEAEGGEVEAEFCPGAYSVRSGGSGGVKRAGLAQRVTKRAARIEALVVVERTPELVPVLEAFYGALRKPFRPSSVADLPLKVEEVVGAISDEVDERYGLVEVEMPEAKLKQAREMCGEWRVQI